MSIIFKSLIASICVILFLTGFSPHLTGFVEKSLKTSIPNEYRLLQHEKVIYISIKEQKLYIIYNKKVIGDFNISSSKYGVGFEKGSKKTPLGLHYISRKIGEDVPLNGIFKYREFSGEVSVPNHTSYLDKDLITTRILWLSGQEKDNKYSFNRHIYIHGTPEELNIGSPASHGCIRMKNIDVYALFEFVEKGTPVLIR